MYIPVYPHVFAPYILLVDATLIACMVMVLVTVLVFIGVGVGVGNAHIYI